MRKYENALFSLKAEFDQFAVGVGDDAVKVRLGLAVLPAAIGFGDLLVAIQNREVITVDKEAVVASLDFGLADLHGVSNRESGGHGLRECRLHSYRRRAPGICFVEQRKFFVFFLHTRYPKKGHGMLTLPCEASPRFIYIHGHGPIAGCES